MASNRVYPELLVVFWMALASYMDQLEDYMVALEKVVVLAEVLVEEPVVVVAAVLRLLAAPQVTVVANRIHFCQVVPVLMLEALLVLVF